MDNISTPHPHSSLQSDGKIECPICFSRIKKSSLSKHQKSKKHQRNLDQANANATHLEYRDCDICFDSRLRHSFTACPSCSKDWCASCSQNIFRCPFCRFLIPGLEEKEKENARMLIDWYSSSEGFQPTSDEVRIRFFFNDDQGNTEEISNVISNLQNLLRQRLQNITSITSLGSYAVVESEESILVEHSSEAQQPQDPVQEIDGQRLQLLESIALLAQEFEQIDRISEISISTFEYISEDSSPSESQESSRAPTPTA